MEIAQWVFFGPAKLAALWPYSGVAIAIGFIALQAIVYARAGSPFDQAFFRKAPVFAGLLWLIFGFYEMQVQAILVQPANAAPLLRLDMIVLTPILYVLSAMAIGSIWRAFTGIANK